MLGYKTVSIKFFRGWLLVAVPGIADESDITIFLKICSNICRIHDDPEVERDRGQSKRWKAECKSMGRNQEAGKHREGKVNLSKKLRIPRKMTKISQFLWFNQELLQCPMKQRLVSSIIPLWS